MTLSIALLLAALLFGALFLVVAGGLANDPAPSLSGDLPIAVLCLLAAGGCLLAAAGVELMGALS